MARGAPQRLRRGRGLREEGLMHDHLTRPLFGLSIQERFERFHDENPEVYELLVRFAHEAHAAGRSRLGIGALWERLRWHTSVETEGEPYKLNDNYRSRYARLLAERNPELAHLFETRKLRAA